MTSNEVFLSKSRSNPMRFELPALTLLVMLLSGGSVLAVDTGEEFFERKIRPILSNHCFACHGPKAQMAGLNLSTAADFFKGSSNGPVVVPGDPENSRIVQVLSYQDKVKMPPTGKLPDEQIADLKKWIDIGAPWPDSVDEDSASGSSKIQTSNPTGRDFWSFQPVWKSTPPAVRNRAWVRTPVDQFILAKLEERGISPAPPAGKLTLLRRATFDLTGLPPTQEEIDAFLADRSLEAFSKVVDRLLASPRYGERWGRHWLDVARYADSTGADEDQLYPHAWRYRDYVIGAFNQDLPYKQFILEQLAGDLLPAARSGRINVNGIVATGLLALGPKPIAQQDKARMIYDVVDEQIDVISKAFLGLTVACARCHDHKFDPISTKDYYSLAAIFASTKSFKKIEGTVSQIYYHPLVASEVYGHYEQHQRKITAKQIEIDGIVDEEAARYSRRLRARLADYMVAARGVYQLRASAGELSTRQGLEPNVLDRWVHYLSPGDEVRPHLERWHQAQESSVAVIAKEYQTQFGASAGEWEEILAAWKTTFNTALASQMELPERPKFDAGKDRFFYEVFFGRADPDTGKIIQRGPLTLPEKGEEQAFSRNSLEELARLRLELEQLRKSSPPEPPMACAVAEGPDVQQRVFIRGSHENPGETVRKGFPEVLTEERRPEISRGSGRLELAQWLTSSNHPLTARVMANRIWQWHFGEGLVRTPNNYGRMGSKPTHPELLDFLAQRFIESGWSIKAMHRHIMLSSAYQMSGEITDSKAEADPANELWSRFNRRRLAVEEMRDSLLSLDGSLDLTVGGALITETVEAKDANKLSCADWIQCTRRTVYLPLRRSNLLTLLNLFDFGDATTSSEGRTRTNIAPQALFLMNSEFVDERSRRFAEFLLKNPELDDAKRFRQAYKVTLGRDPTVSEIENAIRYMAGFPQGTSGESSRLEGWQSFCRILMASNEFILCGLV